MATISVTYQLKWGLKNTSYCITKCKKIINVKTGRLKKKTVHNGIVGFWIGRKFLSLESINKLSVKIEQKYCPF